MNYVNVKILPTPYNVEFKRAGRLIFDINYADCSIFETERWLNSKEQYHRENGPASIWDDGYQYWYRYNKFHRENGPARIWNNGRQFWYLNDIRYSEKDFNEEMRRRNGLRKRKNLTETSYC